MNIPVRASVLVAVVTSALAVAQPALAQVSSGDGFLFQHPSGSFSLRGGFAMPSAGSDVFSYTTSTFTVGRGDFSALDLGADLSFTVAPRWDLAFDLSYSGMSKGSEYRNFVDNNQQPIEQSTSLQRTPVTVNARYYLTDRGRQIGHYAWVPNSIVPYVGAGLGMMYYEFGQKGDFIDSSTLLVNPDELHSGGWAPVAQLLAGAEWSLGSRWALRTEARYLSSGASLSSDFQGFHRIDLSGVTTSVGLFVRF